MVLRPGEDDVVVWGFARSQMPGKAIDLHAEMDCICQAAQQGKSLAGLTMFVTSAPCAQCLPLIVASGIKCVVHSDLTSRYIPPKKLEWARSLAAEYACALVSDVERPQYARFDESSRRLPKRDQRAEAAIDLDRLQPNAKRRKAEIATAADAVAAAADAANPHETA